MVAGKIVKTHLPRQSRDVFLCFYCCLLIIIARATIKATANIVNAITALKSMYIIVIK